MSDSKIELSTESGWVKRLGTKYSKRSTVPPHEVMLAGTELAVVE